MNKLKIPSQDDNIFTQPIDIDFWKRYPMKESTITLKMERVYKESFKESVFRFIGNILKIIKGKQ